MFLRTVKVGSFKSINTPQDVAIDEEVTVLVGMNEAGKTIFLKALEKSNDALNLAKFDPVDDYPRKDLSRYLRQHSTNPAEATVLTYALTDDEISDLNDELSTEIAAGFTFSVTNHYNNNPTILISVDESPVIEKLLSEYNLSHDAKTAIEDAKSIRAIAKKLEEIDLTEKDKYFLERINARVQQTKCDSVVESEVWEWLEPRIPKFLYFSDYDLLPGKTNLADLANRVEQSKSNPKQLQPKHYAVLSLLRMAGIDINDLSDSYGYESLKSRMKAVSIDLTNQIMEFWKQNEDIEVDVDVRADPVDEPPFNQGNNLYLRIKNNRHRGVDTSFDQRSRGFIWFFSFLVWFDSVQEKIHATQNLGERQLILLLDEPGLALHALAQADFLRYIDELAKKHQVLYTTHSPFMVHSDRLHQVRMVEDKPKEGTVISNNLSGSDPRTIFPLQAALGWTVAQNLFISKRNLLVEGASDLIYLKAMSSILEAKGKTGLHNDITIVPVGGLDNVVTFIALLGANNLKIAVFHDYKGKPEQKIENLLKEKLISSRAILNASQFRDIDKIGTDGLASDTEDLFEPECYLEYFNKTFSKQLAGIAIKESELPNQDRIISRIESYLKKENIQLRPSGGFNHYTVASFFASNPPVALNDNMVERFEELFKRINGLFFNNIR